MSNYESRRGSVTMKSDTLKLYNYFKSHQKAQTNVIPKVENSASAKKNTTKSNSQNQKMEVEDYKSQRRLSMNLLKKIPSNLNIKIKIVNKTPENDSQKQSKQLQLNYSSNHNEKIQQGEFPFKLKTEPIFFIEQKKKQQIEKDYKQNKELSNSILLKGSEKQLNSQQSSNNIINQESEKKERTRAITELICDKKTDQFIPQLSDNNIKYQNQITQLEDQLKKKIKIIEDLTCKLKQLKNQLYLEQYQYKETHNKSEDQREKIILLQQELQKNQKYENQFIESERLCEENKIQIQKLKNIISEQEVKIIQGENIISKQRKFYEQIIFNQLKKLQQNKREIGKTQNLNQLLNNHFNSFIKTFYQELCHYLIDYENYQFNNQGQRDDQLIQLQQYFILMNFPFENIMNYRRQQQMKSITNSTQTLNQQDELSYSLIEFANMQDIKNYFEQNSQRLLELSSIQSIDI